MVLKVESWKLKVEIWKYSVYKVYFITFKESEFYEQISSTQYHYINAYI